MDEDYYSSQSTQEILPPENQPAYGQEPPYEQPAEPPRPSAMATASLVLGILSIVFTCCCCGGFIFGSLGIIFALLSRVDHTMEGRAKAGLITGIIGMVLTVILFFVLIVAGVLSETPAAPYIPNMDTLFIHGLGGAL